MAKQPCPFFAIGICKLGDKCAMSHDLAAANSHAAREQKSGQKPAHPDWRTQVKPAASSQRAPVKKTVISGQMAAVNAAANTQEVPEKRFVNPGRTNKEEDELVELRKNFLYTIPRDAKAISKARGLGDGDLAAFLNRAVQLTEAGDTYMQGAIERLASEGGLFRLRGLLRRSFAAMDASTLEKIWNTQLLPYFKIISHELVLASAVIEDKHTTLLNSLYNVDGQQAVAVFSAAARQLAAKASRESSVVVIKALACVLERNPAAHVNADMQTVAEGLISALQSSRERSIMRCIRSIRITLKLGTDMPEVNNIPNPASLNLVTARPTFTVEQDLPGELSSDGPRHDNDKADIREIEILPTMQEILSSRQEYLPREDPSQWHVTGMAGLLDRQFRLLREDTVGLLRDAAKFELERMLNPESAKGQPRQGARTYVYPNTMLQDARFDDRKGLQFVLSFDQPEHLFGKSTTHRTAWWEDSLRLTPDSLICLLSSDGHASFLVVHNPGRSCGKKKGLNDQYTLAKDPLRAHVIARLNDTSPEAATEFLNRHTSGLNLARHALIEFPGVVLPAFGPTLEALQGIAQSQDMPFAEFLVPGDAAGALHPPAYSTQPGFRYNLQSLLPESERKTQPAGGNQEQDMEALLEQSVLDEAQQKAVKGTLSNSIALIQGPPGTGKSFTGVKLIKTLLDNRKAGKLGPIICVCFSNHALDQLLEHLVDADVKQIIRVGTRSKSERLAEINLAHIAKKYELTKMEREKRGKAKGAMHKTSGKIGHALARHINVLHRPEKEVLAYLEKHHPHLHMQLSWDVDEEGFEYVGRRDMSPLQSWLCGDSGTMTDRTLDELQANDVPLAQLTRTERGRLCQSWMEAITSEVFEELEVQMSSFNEDQQTFEAVRNELDLRILSSASVIGITTTGLARNLKHLRKLPSKVLVVEEAGEVLEAHLLTAMLPSLEHVVLIGDHQQLRPRVQNYELSVENPRSHFALDISLFERLVHPRHGVSAGLPFVTLMTQRRMHPSISTLVRSTLYPNLQDVESVHDYPPVKGIRRRLFWLDHDKKEDAKNEHLHSTSHTNEFEVDMVTKLVRHLQRQSEYSANDIAVLTPYLGQLRKLRKTLSGFTDIILNDRDQDELVQDGEEEEDSQTIETRRPQVTKGSLLKAVRLATVDNYQGEEAKVVIISLVRCNDQHKCGFLRTPNRINVLLSRAQHGMYIVGNRATSEHVDMWREVIGIFEAENNIGTQLELACPRHPDRPLEVSEPEDFARVVPEAGCDHKCGKQLLCGHSCRAKCHSDRLHDAVYCMQDCTRPKKGCSHRCELPCGADCEKQCNVIVECDITLDCGHRVTALPCYEHQDIKQVLCDATVDKIVPGCNHTVSVPCFVSVDSPCYRCDQECSAPLHCGHECGKPCCECQPKDGEGGITESDHGACERVCGKNFSSCEHSCRDVCHEGQECKACEAPCSSSCAHGLCPKRCTEPCAPCAEYVCPSSCPHAQCNMPCGAPCDWVPCGRRCEKKLECLHQCPGMCGEACPTAMSCQVCAPENVLSMTADLITMKTYRDLDLDATPCMILPCGHIFTVETLDQQMGMAEHYEMQDVAGTSQPIAVRGDPKPFCNEKPKACPNCRSSLRNVSRYGRIVRRSLLDESTKKFITWANRLYLPLAERLRKLEEALKDSAHKAQVKGNIKLDGSPMMALLLPAAAGDRYANLIGLRRRILSFLGKVQVEEQPFQKVCDIVEAVRRRHGVEIPAFDFDQTILQTRGELLAQALLLRCELIMFKDLLTIYEEMDYEERKDFTVVINLRSGRKACDDLLEKAEKSMHVLQQAEANIFWAYFAALEYGYSLSSDTIAHLEQEGNARLNSAQQLCDEYPKQTASVSAGIAAVRKMFTDSISKAEMGMVVVTMEEFSGTGHWYRCINGHPFTIGECGGPNQTSQCLPRCGKPIGGEDHHAAEGVTVAHDIEQEFGNLQI